MSEQTLNLKTSPQLAEQRELAYAQREEALKHLLDPSADGQPMVHHPNYEYAKDSGLLDMFYFDPDTGKDALRHVLHGEVQLEENGSRKVAGFHHEPSGIHPDTYVDYEHLATKTSKAMRDYRRAPFSPYSAPVVINGYSKGVIKRKDDGSYETVAAKSSMFPAEYDPLTIMQAARIALETRDPRNDEMSDRGSIVTEGFAPMLNGVNHMKLRFFLDADSGKIMSVFPVVRKSDLVHMTTEETKQHLGL